MPTVSISVSDIAYRYLHAGKKGSRVNGVSARANRAIVDWIKADQLTKDIKELRKEMEGLRADKKQLYLLLGTGCKILQIGYLVMKKNEIERFLGNGRNNLLRCRW